MTNRGCILVLENRGIEFEKYEEALHSVGISCEVMLDSDDFLDRVIETIPNESELPWKYAAASLDLKTKVPTRASAPATSNGGAWFLREVLRANGEENDYLRPGQAVVASNIPLSFLTNFEKDQELIRLHREFDNTGHGFSIIKKRPDVAEYVAWAENAVEMRNKGKSDGSTAQDALTRYDDACLTVTRLCQSLGVPNRDIIALLTGGSDMPGLGDPNKLNDVAAEVLRLYPATNVLAPTVLADRWEAITQIIADTFTVFNEDAQIALRDLNAPLNYFGAKSSLEIMMSGSNIDIVALLGYHEQRWGRA